jgi:uncharacterized protein YecT (DUF1311 family)
VADRLAAPPKPRPLARPLAPREEEDASDDYSPDRHDGPVYTQVESDDTTDLADLEEPVGDPDTDYGEPSGSALGKLLLALVVLVLIAGIGGWVVVRQALRADDPVAESQAPSASPSLVALAPPPLADDPEDPPTAAEPGEADRPGTGSKPAEVILPSFPCAKAESKVELLICGSAELAALDRRMAKTYSGARKGLEPEDAKALREAQKRWLRSRDACDDAACVTRRYRGRLAELE